MTGYAGDLTPAEAWELLHTRTDAVLIDVRTDREWREIGVPDTESPAGPPAFVEWTDSAGRPNPRFVADLEALGLRAGGERPVVFLCRSGVRSIHAARAATTAGLGPAYNVLEGFEGGLDAQGRRGHEGWRAAGLPWHQP